MKGTRKGTGRRAGKGKVVVQVYLVVGMAIGGVVDVVVVDVQGSRIGKWFIVSWFAWWCREREM